MKTISKFLFTMVALCAALVSPATAVLASGYGGFGALNGTPYERGFEFLSIVQDLPGPLGDSLRKKVGKEVLEGLALGKMGAFPSDYYFRKEFSTTDGEFIKGVDPLKNGFTNFDKGRLAKDEVLILTDIQLSWAQHLSSDNKTADMVLYSPVVHDLIKSPTLGTLDTDAGTTGNQLNVVATQRIDTAIINSAFRFSIGPDLILEGNYDDFFVNNFTGVELPANGYVPLRTPKIITGDQLMKWFSTHPENATWTGSTDFFLQIKFGGIKLRPISL